MNVVSVYDNGDGTALMQFDALVIDVGLPAGGITLNGGGVNDANAFSDTIVQISSNAYGGSGDPWAITSAVNWITFANGGSIVHPQSGTVS